MIPVIVAVLGVEYVTQDLHGALRILVVGVAYVLAVVVFRVVDFPRLRRLMSGKDAEAG